MSDQDWVLAAMVLAPTMLIVFWLAAAMIVPRIMGWTALEELYPDRPEDPAIERFLFQALYVTKAESSHLGMSYRGCVTLTACQSGLRISIWKLFQPFSRPIHIPWGEIEAVTSKVIGIRVCSLLVGREQHYKLSIIARIARRIERATGGKLNLPQDLK